MDRSRSEHADPFSRGFFEGDEYSLKAVVETVASKCLRERREHDNTSASFSSSPPPTAVKRRWRASPSTLLESLRGELNNLEDLHRSLQDYSIALEKSKATEEQRGTSSAWDSNSTVATLTRDILSLEAALKDLNNRKEELESSSKPLKSKIQTLAHQKKLASQGVMAMECLMAHAVDGPQESAVEFSRGSDLPQSLRDPSQLQEAMITVASLQMLLAHLLEERKKRHDAGSSTGAMVAGSIEDIAQRLELQRNVLDNKIVARFDAAVADKDISSMAECARIMASADAAMDHCAWNFTDEGSRRDIGRRFSAPLRFMDTDERQTSPSFGATPPRKAPRKGLYGSSSFSATALLVSRYISTRPIFVESTSKSAWDVESDAAEDCSASETATTTVAHALDPVAHGTNAEEETEEEAGCAARSRAVSMALHKLSAALRDEAMMMEQVFPDPSQAILEFVERVFDQTVSEVVQKVLLPQPRLDTNRHRSLQHQHLRSYLGLFSECYRKILAFAEEATGLVIGGSHGGASPRDLTDEAFGTDLLRSHLPLELLWLADLGSATLVRSSQKDFSKEAIAIEVVLDLISMHEESTKRCLQMTPPSSSVRASQIRCLWLGEYQEQDRGYPGFGHRVSDFFRNSSTDAAIECWSERYLGMVDGMTKKDGSRPSGLLQQCAIHILKGIRDSMETCALRLHGTSNAAREILSSTASKGMDGADVRHGEDLTDKMNGLALDSTRDAVIESRKHVHRRSLSRILWAETSTNHDVPISSGSKEPRQHSLVHQDVANSLGILFKSLRIAVEAVAVLKRYCCRTVVPHVSPSPSDLSMCLNGLDGLIGAINIVSAEALEGALGGFVRRLAATLISHQLKSDFRPSAKRLKGIDRSVPKAGDHSGTSHKAQTAWHSSFGDVPTAACVIAAELLRAACEEAWCYLHGSNLLSFLVELARRTAGVVEAHASRYVFNSEGALQWRRDVAEIAACIRKQWDRFQNNKDAVQKAEGNFGGEIGSRRDVSVVGSKKAASAISSTFENLELLSNLLIVPAAGVPELLDSLPPSIARYRALKMIERREDFKTARIGELSLAEVVQSKIYDSQRIPQ